MPRENTILECIFLAHNQNEKLKISAEELSKLNIKGRIRSLQLSEMDPAEIVVFYTNVEIMQ